MELRDYDDVKMYEKSYTDKMKKYKMDNTSERKTLITEYYSLGTIDGFRGIEQNQNG
jgi:hypothetical protein